MPGRGVIAVQRVGLIQVVFFSLALKAELLAFLFNCGLQLLAELSPGEARRDGGEEFNDDGTLVAVLITPRPENAGVERHGDAGDLKRFIKFDDAGLILGCAAGGGAGALGEDDNLPAFGLF